MDKNVYLVTILGYLHGPGQVGCSRKYLRLKVS